MLSFSADPRNTNSSSSGLRSYVSSSSSRRSLLLSSLEIAEKYLIADLVSLVLLLAAVGLSLKLAHPVYRVVKENDPALDFPLKPSQVPLWLLFVFAAFLPMTIFSTVWMTQKPASRTHRPDLDLLHATVSLFQSTIWSICITQWLKLLAGRPRPNFFALCKFQNGACSASQKIIDDARRSFPSGHASFAFAGLSLLSYYALGKLRISSYKSNAQSENAALPSSSGSGTMSPNSNDINTLPSSIGQEILRILGKSSTWKVCVGLSPNVLAAWIAITRVQDYWHNYDDVLAGAIIGLFCAWFAYHLHYPAIWDKKNAHKPLSASNQRIRGSHQNLYIETL